MAWNAPRVWKSELVDADLLNEQLRDNLLWIAGAGITGSESFTPSWTSSGTPPAIGNGTLLGRYFRVGPWVVFHAEMACGSTTTYGTGNYYWALPLAPRAGDTGMGHGIIEDAGTAYHSFELSRIVAGPTFTLRYGGTSLTQASQTGPMTWANGDKFWGWGLYEV